MSPSASFTMGPAMVADIVRHAEARSVFRQALEYSVRVCLERWVSGCEPTLIYSGGKFRGLGVVGGDGTIYVHAPPTDKYYPASGTGYPPDWDFYAGAAP